MPLLATMTAAGCAATGPFAPTAPDDWNVGVRTRPAWPAGVPLRVRVDFEGAPLADAPLIAEARPVMPGGEAASRYVPPAGAAEERESLSDHTAPVGVPPRDTAALDFDLKVFRGKAGLYAARWTGRTTVPVEIVDDVDLAMTPVRDPAIDRLLTHETHWVLWRGAPRADPAPWYVRINYLPRNLDPVEDLTFGLRLEILRDRRVVGTAGGWIEMKPSGCCSSQAIGHFDEPQAFRVEGDPKVLEAMARDGARWSLRITSDPEMALRNFDCRRYWAGEVEVPVEVVGSN